MHAKSSDVEAEKDAKRALSWITKPLEQLILSQNHNDHVYGVVIVGSGYGGSIAAAEFSRCQKNGKPISVCVLERGNEYLAGQFPSRLASLAKHVRFTTPDSKDVQGQREGLFDFRVGKEVNTLIANGLGGGSLINAGVMEIPNKSVFQQGWPNAIAQEDKLDSYYTRVRKMLGGSTQNGKTNTIEDHSEQKRQPLHKFTAIKSLAESAIGEQAPFRPAALSIAMQDKTNSAGVVLTQCKLCGDCATGCNHNAKDSLDLGLLVQAANAGAELYIGATVLKIKKDKDTVGESVWCLNVVYSNEALKKRQDKPLKLKARKLVLAAGTLGSTEILLRSQTNGLQFSDELGKRFSTNGDMVAAAYDQNYTVNAVAEEKIAPDKRHIGPSITGIIDLRDERENKGLVIEELAVPVALSRLFSELYTTANTLYELGEMDHSQHFQGPVIEDVCAVDPQKIERTSILAVISHDSASGKLELDEDSNAAQEGLLKISWPGVEKDTIFTKQIDSLTKLHNRSILGGRIIANPAWQLVPKSMNFLVGNRRGSLITVHPLGGCAMADNVQQGVVNHLGQVFNPQVENGLLENLVVMDGAVIPTSLGTNPALSIAALSLRAAEKLAE